MAIIGVHSFGEVPKPVLAFNFDTPAKVQPNEGTADVQAELEGVAIIGQSGSGVSGKPGDHALVLAPESATGTDGILSLEDVPGARGLEQMTVIIWYRCHEGSLPGKGERLADYGGNWLFFSDAPGRLVAQVPTGGPGQSAPSHAYDDSGWVFAAFTYDFASSTVSYYKGTRGTPVSFVVDRHSYTERMKSNRTPLQFGNNHARTRAFAGSLDAIQVFDQVLGLSELEMIRQADLQR